MKKLFVGLFAGALVFVGAPAAQAAAPRPVNVVTLGDSYAAGTGAGDYEPGTEGQCWRSANSASADLVAKARAAGRSVHYTDVACSGATIQDLRQSFSGEPPQLDALTSRTDVVVLTVGANDVGFTSYGGLCIQADCSGAPTAAVLAQVPTMTQNLVTLLRDIKTRSPHAQIVLAGYGAQLNPGPNATGVALDPICDDGVATPQERIEGNSVSSALDAGLRSASASARSRGVAVTYVSPYKAGSVALRPSFVGHSLCEALPPYYRGLEALAPGQEGPDVVLHLNGAGQAALADLIEHTFLSLVH